MMKHCVLLILALTAPLAAQPREKICLNGVWKFSPGDIRQETLPKEVAWFDLPVPSFWDAAE
jgi:hypothetical protein